MYTIKREADLEEDAGARAASSPGGSFSPPICIGADLLTETLTGVTFYCTGKQKTLMPHRQPLSGAPHLHSDSPGQAAGRQGLRRVTGGGGVGKQEEERERSGNGWRERKVEIKWSVMS